MSFSAPPQPRGLPNELLHQILGELPIADRWTCCRTSRALYLVVAPPLYSELTLDLQARHHQLLGRKFRSLRECSSTLLRNPVPPSLSFTTNLTLLSHNSTLCDYYDEVSLPNLHHLHVRPHFGGYFCRTPCTSAIRPEPALCPLLASLHPRTMTIGRDDLGITGSESGLWTPTDVFSDRVETLVIYIGGAGGANGGPKDSFLSHLPSTVRTITFIISAASVGRSDPHRCLPAFPALPASRGNDPLAVEVVGLERRSSKWSSTTVEAVKRSIREMVAADGRVESKAGGSEAANEPEGLGDVVFLTMEEYEKREVQARC